MKLSKSDTKRFWSHVDRRGKNECWEWTICCDGRGYGSFSANGKSLTASRVSWEIKHKRKVRKGFVIAHAPIICHNKKCVNPNHLSEKTQKQNAADRILDGTARMRESHNLAKMNWKKVREMRRLRKEKNMSHKELSARFNICMAQVSNIIREVMWKE